MKKSVRKLFFVLILFSCSIITLNSYELSDFVNDVYNQELSDDQIRNKYNQLVETISNEENQSYEYYLKNAYASYYMARAYQSFDNVQTVLNHNTEMRKGKYLSLIAYYNQKDNAVLFYNQALRLIEKASEINKTSEIYRLKSDCTSQLCLLTNLGFMITNGPSISKLAGKALEINPSNAKAALLIASAKVYPPHIYGGDEDAAIKALGKILKNFNMDKEDQFNTYIGFAYCYIIKQNKSESNKWTKKALEIFPGNIYANALQNMANNF